MKHKITKQSYDYTCADGCCGESGTTWTLNGKEVYSGPQEDEAFLRILTELGIQAEIVGLEYDTGEEAWGIDNFLDVPKETE